MPPAASALSPSRPCPGLFSQAAWKKGRGKEPLPGFVATGSRPPAPLPTQSSSFPATHFYADRSPSTLRNLRQLRRTPPGSRAHPLANHLPFASDRWGL